jgi:hypothetical protein
MKRWLGLWLLPLGFTATTQASVLTNYGLEDLIEHSALIVQADVLDRRSEAADAAHANDIHTVVTLRVSQVFKGDLPQNDLELSFLGGAVNGEVLEVSGQFIPSAGERALFFISSPATHQINPLTGWFQGYFPIQEDGGAEYLDLSERPDLILANFATDPLLRKLLNLGMDEAELERRFPGYARFTLEDFQRAIAADVAAAKVAP